MESNTTMPSKPEKRDIQVLAGEKCLRLSVIFSAVLRNCGPCTFSFNNSIDQRLLFQKRRRVDRITRLNQGLRLFQLITAVVMNCAQRLSRGNLVPDLLFHQDPDCRVNHSFLARRSAPEQQPSTARPS